MEITKSLKGLSKLDINKSKTKIRIAAFVRELSENQSLGLSYREISNLFNEISFQEYGYEDPDIPCEQDTFEKAVRREIECNPFFAKPDKF